MLKELRRNLAKELDFRLEVQGIRVEVFRARPRARRWVLEELRRNLAKELDFRLEAGNALRLAAAMAGRRSVAVPRPVPEVGGKTL